jgi:endogenous inhibitor of DNA gyrase (YacG/DUF329 family)
MRLTEADKEKILKMRRNGLGYRNIAKVLGLNADTIKSFVRRNGLGGILVDKERDISDFCPVCGELLVQTPNKRRKTYCSDRCRLKGWQQRQRERSGEASNK